MFQGHFNTVAKTYPSFSVGKSLVGILMDWSDQQFNGLEQAGVGTKLHYWDMFSCIL